MSFVKKKKKQTTKFLVVKIKYIKINGNLIFYTVVNA